LPEPEVVPAPATPATAATTTAPLPSPSPRIGNLPTAQDLIAQGIALPPLQLNLHVYDETPASRYILLNSRRLREGDEVADGVRVESIVPRGVVLNARGRRFVLLAGG
jgi:general secretion pathway protein B